MKFSEQQREILCALLAEYNPADPEVETWGVPWQADARNRSQQSSRSRALRELEGRGLVVRQNRRRGPYRQSPHEPFPGRTTHVALTDRALELKESICR